ncbi:hypothetical protein [Candidatus Symbiopectobacterium sp. 'North America']|uniref:hypothetical protein n=1 Tax=Candidatus Symbiopectobacterium sp. 'North America' TaxID=2794574 RepID=UPI001FD491CF|nr:hypothetical protein [Candidatus Symbiopectobacterium sp. 'North America']
MSRTIIDGEIMTNQTEGARRAYRQLCETLGLTLPITFLDIAAEQTVVVASPDADAPRLALGYEKAAATFFRHLPPTPDEMERAIMTVEDEVTRIRQQVDTQHPLYLCDPALTSLADTTGVPANAHGWHIEQDDIERLFKRFEQVMLGCPASWEAIPLDNAFTARLLILREFMHHLGYLSVFIVNTTASESP